MGIANIDIGLDVNERHSVSNKFKYRSFELIKRYVFFKKKFEMFTF